MILAREYIFKYCPSLLSLANLSISEWEKINKRFLERREHINNTIKAINSITVATTIYEVIILGESGSKPLISFLEFIDYLCKQIIQTIPQIHHTRLRKSAINILSNFDQERSCYLDSIGEFIALLNILKTSNFHLSEVETILPSGKKADFAILNTITGRILQIEILNIHFIDGKINTKNDLYNFLSKRIEDKLISKIGKLYVDEKYKDFALLPVAWCSLDEVQNFPSAFIEVEKKYPMLPICVVAQQHRLEDDKYGFLFATVPELLKQMTK